MAKEYRPRLTEEEYNIVQKFREGKDLSADNSFESTTETHGYESADVSDDRFVDYCKKYGLDISKVKSYKFVNHQGQAAFNIVFNEDVYLDFNVDEIKEELKSYISNTLIYDPKKAAYDDSDVGVVTITDLHFGAYIDNMLRSNDFSISILSDMLSNISGIVNSIGYSKVHVHILGDIIESFTGLNHQNTWKGLDKGMVGSEVVKLATTVLHSNLLSKIGNLGKVKVVGSNHDRVTSNNDEDVKGEAADIISWGLSLLGYDIEFNPLVLSHKVDGINYILNHGHHGITKQTAEEICWKYGDQNCFNFITEGHLHTRIQKLTAKSKEKFKLIKEDTLDLRRQVCPSLFTGNFYSESNGWETNPGFIISEDNGKGKPNVFDYSL